MKKIIKYKALTIVFVMAAVISCDQEKDVEAIDTGNKAVVAIEHESGPSSGTVNENDLTEIVYKVTLDKIVAGPVTITARQTGGTADDHDYTIEDAVIPAYTKEAELKILINEDTEPEDLETVQFEIGPLDVASNHRLNLPQVTNQTLSLSIGNFISDEVEISFAWAQDITVEEPDGDDEDIIHTCDSVDFDIFIADAEGFDVNDPWATANPAIAAATGDCPEEMTFTGLPDGSYIIFANLWSNLLNDEGLDTPLPITATFNRDGAFHDIVVEQDASQVINSDTPGADDDTYAGEVVDVYIAKVTISNGVYTIQAFNGDVAASGRKRNPNRTPRPASTMTKK